jgi:uncharacterized protein
MLLKIHEFRRRVHSEMDQLVGDLQHLTHRFGFAEEQAWRSSLPRLSAAFSDPSFAELDLYFGGEGNLSLEYRLPACGSWADMVLLGRHGEKPSAVIVELKDWMTQGDLPGPGEGLMQRPGRVDQHPSYQVRGYVEWCRQFHSAVQEREAEVHGCVVFTKDPYYASYTLKPNDGLTRDYPCFSVDPTDVALRLPALTVIQLADFLGYAFRAKNARIGADGLLWHLRRATLCREARDQGAWKASASTTSSPP